MNDDEPIIRKTIHEVGQEISALSIEELNDRIKLLEAEIARLHAAVASKQGSRTIADQFFKNN